MYYLCCASSCDSEALIDYQTQCHSLPPDTCDDKKTYKRICLPYVLEKEPSLNMHLPHWNYVQILWNVNARI